MNTKAVVLMAALLAAVPAVAREAESGGGGNDDPAGHDAGDDRGGKGRGADDGAAESRGGSGGSGGSWARARRDLVRDAGSSDADVRGHVEVRTRSGRERFQVEAERLDAGAAVEFFVDDGTGTLVSAGSLAADATGEAELELDTGDGAALPAGAATVADLAGRRVEVRDGAGGLLLSGTVPSTDGAAANLRGRTLVRDEASGVRAKVEMKILGRSGRQEFRLEVKKASPGATVELWIDDGSGTLVLAGSAAASAGGKARLRLDTRRGDALPLGAGSLADLSGRVFEARVDGLTAASGNLPTL